MRPKLRLGNDGKEKKRRIVSLWQQRRYDTADIAALTGVPEAKVEIILHRWREDKRLNRPLAAYTLQTPSLYTPRLSKRQVMRLEDACEIARAWEAGRPLRH